MIDAFCPTCGTQVPLEVISLDSGPRCPRCGASDLEAATAPGLLDREEFSHRLRTPLTVVKGSLQHLVKHWDDLGDRDRKVLVKAVLAQADIAIDEIATLEDRLSAARPRAAAREEQTASD